MTSYYYISDEELFKDPPTRPNCPVCEIRLPVEAETTYMSCCGKVICDGCVSENKAANNWLAEHDDAMSNYKLDSQYFSRGDLEKSRSYGTSRQSRDQSWYITILLARICRVWAVRKMKKRLCTIGNWQLLVGMNRQGTTSATLPLIGDRMSWLSSI